MSTPGEGGGGGEGQDSTIFGPLLVLCVCSLTCGSLRSDATPPPPNASSNTKLNALIPGSSYLQQRGNADLDYITI